MEPINNRHPFMSPYPPPQPMIHYHNGRPVPPELHPNRRYRYMLPSLPGPLNICPTCRRDYGQEWERDMHYLRVHQLRLGEGYNEYEAEAYEVQKRPNYDGPLGKAAHTLEPWVFCAEPEQYADEHGNAIVRKDYQPPDSAFVWKDGKWFLDLGRLDAEGTAWFSREWNARTARRDARCTPVQADQNRILGVARVRKR